MDALKLAELHIKQGYAALQAIKEPSDDEAWLYIELGLLLQDLKIIRARDSGAFYVSTPLELN
jgi:hypothetical protein